MRKEAEGSRAFLVGDLEDGFEATLHEGCENVVITTQQFSGGAGLQWLGKDAVGVLHVGYHDVFVTFTGSDRKVICLVGSNLSRQVSTLNCDQVGSDMWSR